MKKIALIAFALTSIAIAQTAGKLGIFEGASDVGTPSHKGSVSYDATRNEYRMTGGGNNMTGFSDERFDELITVSTSIMWWPAGIGWGERIFVRQISSVLYSYTRIPLSRYRVSPPDMPPRA